MADEVKQEGIQVASTIPTPEEVFASLQAKAPAADADAYPPGGSEPAPAAASTQTAASPAPAQTAAATPSASGTPEELDVPYAKMTPGVQKRVDTLTARNLLATQRAEAAEARAAKAEQALARAKTATLPGLQQGEPAMSEDTDSFFDGLIQREAKPGELHEPTAEELENLPPIMQEAAKLTFQMAKEREMEKLKAEAESEVGELTNIIAEQRNRFPELQSSEAVEAVVREARTKGVPFAALPAMFEAKHLAAVEAENAALRSKLGIEEISSVVPSGGPAIPTRAGKDKIPSPEEVWADLERKRGNG